MEQDVARLDVVVQETGLVHGADSLDDFLGEPLHLLQREVGRRRSFHERLKRAHVHVLRNHVDEFFVREVLHELGETGGAALLLQLQAHFELSHEFCLLFVLLQLLLAEDFDGCGPSRDFMRPSYH